MLRMPFRIILHFLICFKCRFFNGITMSNRKTRWLLHLQQNHSRTISAAPSPMSPLGGYPQFLSCCRDSFLFGLQILGVISVLITTQQCGKTALHIWSITLILLVELTKSTRTTIRRRKFTHINMSPLHVFSQLNIKKVNKRGN